MTAQLWLLIPAAPICLYAAWSDAARMTIPNRAVLALILAFALVGPLVLPPVEYGLRWLHFAGVLLLGFTANALRMLGAGDAKFLAAMAPYVAREDIGAFAYLLAATLVAAFVLHRVAQATPAVRRATPEWQSWRRGRHFPLGLALGPALILYLAMSS